MRHGKGADAAMKKICAGVFAGALAALLHCAPVLAHPPVTVIVDGQALSFDQPPVIRDDRTLVPLRGIFQALGADVYWEESTQTVTALAGSDSVQLRIGDAGLYKNGALAYTMSVPAQIINERTLVPVRAVSESFGAAVGWDEATYTVTIQSGGQIAPTPVQPSGDAGEIQNEPKPGGFTAELRAEDGTTVLTVALKCDILERKAAESINAQMAEIAFAEGQGFLRAYGDEARRAYAAKPDGFRPYSYTGSCRLTRDGDGYASFFATAVSYTGSAEKEAYSSHTYSLSTGKEAALAELVTDSQAELEELWRAGLRAMIAKEPDAFYRDAETRLERVMGSVGFYLTEDGVVFYLPPESIAPADAGLVAFEVEYSF